MNDNKMNFDQFCVEGSGFNNTDGLVKDSYVEVTGIIEGAIPATNRMGVELEVPGIKAITMKWSKER